MQEQNFFFKTIDRIFKGTLAFLILTVTLMVFTQVVLPYVLRAPLMGIEELLVFPTIWLYFLGGANASREGTQIVARVLEVFMKREKAILAIRITGSALALAVSGWLTFWALDYFKYALRVGKESPTLYVPMIYAQTAVFVGMVLMTIYTACQIYKDYGSYKGCSWEEAAPDISEEILEMEGVK